MKGDNDIYFTIGPDDGSATLDLGPFFISSIMKIKAKPTKYNGILYRSRLEATWAAFFDLCGWSHHYEPFDLKGWVPDFEITTNKDWRRLLVEVKPYNFENVDFGEIKASEYDKAISHKEDFDILLLGLGPFLAHNTWHPHLSQIGYFYTKYGRDNTECVGDNAVFKNHYGFSHEYLGWDSPFSDYCRKDFDLSGLAMNLWKEAVSKTRTNYINRDSWYK